MGQVDRGPVQHELGRLLRDGISARSDAELLGRFGATGDEAAFEALVTRHGPMVRGVCGRLLRDPHDVDDAFQATFLVLARKGPGLRDPDRLAPWLYGVASRVAAKARGRKARLAARPLSDDLPARDDPRAEWSDLRAIVDAELARLPSKQRDVLVACLLAGASEQEAARSLACPVGTVKSRLSRAKEALRGRLVRRGVAPAAALAAVSSGEAFASPASSKLIRATVAAVAAQAAPPPAVAILAQGAAPTMLAKTAAALALVGGLGFLGLASPAWTDGPPAAQPAAAPPRSPKPSAEAARIRDRNLRTILLAMHNYHSANGAFPAAAFRTRFGVPLLSWRVAILPYLDQKALYDEFHLDEPWDSPHNKTLIPRMPPVFQTPDLPAGEGRTRFRGFRASFSVVTFDGGVKHEGTVIPNEKLATMFDSVQGQAAGAALPRGVSLGEVTDGTSNTAFLAVASQDVEWTKPEEIPLTGPEASPPVSNHDPRGYILGMVDGSIRYLPKSTDRDRKLSKLATRAGGEVVSFDPPAQAEGAEGRPPEPAVTDPAIADDERERLISNLKLIGLGMHTYMSARYDLTLPSEAIYAPDGRPLLSWRVALLPHLGAEAKALYEQFHLDEPFDSPHNQALIPRMPKLFETPGLSTPPGQTRIRGYAGEGAAFDPALFAKASRGVQLQEITDGTSNTVFLTVSRASIVWTQPGELPFGPDRAFMKPAEVGPSGYLLLMVDGLVRELPGSLPGRDAIVGAALTRAGDEIIDWSGEKPVEPLRPTEPPVPPAIDRGDVQDPSAPSAPPSVERRLQDIEAKLERILQRLEGPKP